MNNGCHSCQLWGHVLICLFAFSCPTEEFLEAIKVAQQIGTLNITVDGDVSPLCDHSQLVYWVFIFCPSLQPHNPYVEDLHIKLSKPVGRVVHHEAMDTNEVNNAISFVAVVF